MTLDLAKSGPGGVALSSRLPRPPGLQWAKLGFLSPLQDQVDTLTFQSQSLRDRARRFEEALRKNTEEQLEVVVLPRPRGSPRGLTLGVTLAASVWE